MSFTYTISSAGQPLYYQEVGGKKKRVAADKVPASVKRAATGGKSKGAATKKSVKKTAAAKKTTKGVAKKTATRAPKKTTKRAPKKTSATRTAVTTKNVEWTPPKSLFDAARVTKMIAAYAKMMGTMTMSEFRSLVATLKNNVVNSDALTEEQRAKLSKRLTLLQERKKKFDEEVRKKIRTVKGEAEEVMHSPKKSPKKKSTKPEHKTKGCGDSVWETKNWDHSDRAEHRTRGCGDAAWETKNWTHTADREHFTKHWDYSMKNWDHMTHSMRGMCGG